MIKKILWPAFVIFVFFFFSVVFYKNIWYQIINKDPPNQLTIQGETPVYEFVAETVKNNLLSFNNPFITSSALSPFGWRFALDDVAPVNGIYFLVLRPFLSIHQSFMLIIILSVIISGLTMYYLLTLLRINKPIALLVSLVFCFSPFMSIRIGAHPTYTAFYLFTLPSIFFLKLVKNEGIKKILYSVLLAISLSLAFLTNLYFSVMIILMVFFLSLFSFLLVKKEVLILFKKNFWYFLVSLVILIVVLFPWWREVVSIIFSDKLDQPKDWNDIISFSSDLTNMFIPSHGFFYRSLINYLSTRFLYIARIFESFTYPGIIIITATIGYFFISKKLPRQLKPIFYSSLAFLVLTLGPFLQILGNNLKIPLPYIFITYLPLLKMARSPGRFIVPFIFLSSIVTAFMIQFFLKKIRKNWLKWALIFLFFIIFFFDQMTFISTAPSVKLPHKIYQYLANQQVPETVLEIPFSIRDSIKNLGYIHGHWLSYTTLIHRQKTFSIYAGRIPNSIFNYYLNSPLIGPLGKIVNLAAKDFKREVGRINRKDFVDGLDFYGVKYLINKDNEDYSVYIVPFLREAGFKKIATDGNYSLWERSVKTVAYDEINFDSSFDRFGLADGWGNKESQDRSRWAMTNVAQIFLNLKNVNKKQLIIEAEAIVKPQITSIFINDRFAGKMIFSTGKYNKQSLIINSNLLNSGLNKITFKFRDSHILAKIIPGAADIRPLSLHVRYIGLK